MSYIRAAATILGRDQRAVQLRHDIGRCGGRREHRKPGIDGKVGIADLGEGRGDGEAGAGGGRWAL